MPVGLLLYRVARNMRQTMGRKKSGTIRALLDNCLMLLDPNIHSQVGAVVMVTLLAIPYHKFTDVLIMRQDILESERASKRT